MPHLKFHVCKLEARCVCWFSTNLVNKRFHLEPNWTVNGNFSSDQSALLTRFQTDFMSSLWNFLLLSGRSSSLWNISMQQQGVRKYGCFHKLYRAKLQWNAWGMPGVRWAVLELTGSLKINKSPTVWHSKASFSGREVIKPRTLLSLDPPPCSLLWS